MVGTLRLGPVSWTLHYWQYREALTTEHKKSLGSQFVYINMHTWSYSLTVIVINVEQETGSKSHNMAVHCSTNHVVPTQTCMWNNPIYHNMSLCTVPLSVLFHSDMYVKQPNISQYVYVHCSTNHVVPLWHVKWPNISQYVCALFHRPCCPTQTCMWNDPIYIIYHNMSVHCSTTHVVPLRHMKWPNIYRH